MRNRLVSGEAQKTRIEKPVNQVGRGGERGGGGGGGGGRQLSNVGKWGGGGE